MARTCFVVLSLIYASARHRNACHELCRSGGRGRRDAAASPFKAEERRCRRLSARSEGHSVRIIGDGRIYMTPEEFAAAIINA